MTERRQEMYILGGLRGRAHGLHNYLANLARALLGLPRVVCYSSTTVTERRQEMYILGGLRGRAHGLHNYLAKLARALLG